ncbi:MAG: alpha-1,2-fucosyltransferase [Gemmatimonadales bacterium]
MPTVDSIASAANTRAAHRSTKRTLALLCGAGQLGNQLFEAAFAASVLQPGDLVFTTGMAEFVAGFDWPLGPIANLGAAKRRRTIQLWVKRFGKFAARLRLADGIRQQQQDFAVAGVVYRRFGDDVQFSRGACSRVVFIDRGYYQNAAVGNHASFRLKPEHLVASRAFLETLPHGPRAFVHVRRGDYRHWTTFGHSPLLDLQYFRDGIAQIRSASPGTRFILLSDEIAEVASQLAASDVHVFAGANVYEDFGMMTLCDGGVISNSTLSWWGGCLCRRTVPVVAPRHFLARGLGFDYPPGIMADWMTVIDP